jgi:hypothetical protein
MFIGHLPSGYIASKLLYPRLEPAGSALKTYLWAGALGAVAPDFDMMYFYLVDHRMHHHHTYWTHFPIVWACLLFISLIWLSAARVKRLAALATIFSLNGLVHMLLDSIVGDIWWFAPFIDRPFSLFSVPALYKPWWLNFLFNWSFALELVIVALAVYIWRRGDDAGSNLSPVILEHETVQDDRS